MEYSLNGEWINDLFNQVILLKKSVISSKLNDNMVCYNYV